MKRYSYTLSLKFDDVEIDEVIIDQHYCIKHPDMSDGLILELVNIIELFTFIEKTTVGNYSYYLFDPVIYKNKYYRIILLLEENSSYLGVVNAFRVKEKKNGFSI